MYNETLKRLGVNTKNFREDSEINKYVLADEVGMTVEQLELLEKGEFAPSFEQFVNIADALNVTPENLLTEYANVSAKKILRELRLSRFMDSLDTNDLNCVHYVISMMMNIMDNVDIQKALISMGIDGDIK